MASWLRDSGPTVAGEIVFNFVAPVVIYDRVSPGHGDLVALIASSGAPAAWSLVEFARHRRIDAISMMVLAGIALSLLALVGGGSAKVLQLRENLVSGLVGMVFLGSAAIGRPLMYMLASASAARQSTADAAELAAKRDNPGFRRTMTLMTLVWGFGLLASTALACVLVEAMTIHDYLIVSPFVGYGAMAVLGAWTFWYARRAQRRGRAMELAARRVGDRR